MFLKTHEALPSYGEPAVVGDRVVFNLVVGAPSSAPAMQLVNLPAARVDIPRTLRYQETKRAAFYGATLGEAEYAAMTAEVARALDQLSTVPDPQTRLALAEEAETKRYAGVLGVSRDPLVSSDIVGDPRASVVDLELTKVIDGDLDKVMSWYDNEWGYANQMVREAVSISMIDRRQT